MSKVQLADQSGIESPEADGGTNRYDYILVGGGLQSGLIALALKHYQPEASLLIIERSGELGGNHTWSFHPADVPGDAAAWVTPLVEHRWDSYSINLKNNAINVDLQYAAISSEKFRSVLYRDLKVVNASCDTSRHGKSDLSSSGVNRRSGDQVTEEDSCHGKSAEVICHSNVISLSQNLVRTECGNEFFGKVVIDNRGPSRSESTYKQCGFQKFFGFEIELYSDWPKSTPTIMDDRIDQSDGFRFMYTLPFDRRRVLVEDTRFSNSPTIDREECFEKLKEYLTLKGISKWSVLREESGVLPMPISSENFPRSGETLSGGYSGGWFHAATGYSFPMAVAFANAIATTSPEQAKSAVKALAAEHRWRGKYARFLNRLLFCLVKPKARYQIFRRFYRVLSPAAISRFYAHQFSFLDAFRIVVGIPPSGLRPLQFVRSFFPEKQLGFSKNVSLSKECHS